MDIQKVNSSNIVGGPGRLVVKDYDGTFPQNIGEVMDLTAPFDLKGGWKDLGATNDGIAVARGFDTEGFEVDQVVGEVDSDITAWTHTLSTNLAENTVENRQLALIGGNIIQSDPVLGTSTTLTADTAVGATILSVTSAADISAGSYIQISGADGSETRQVDRVEGTSVYVTAPLNNAYTATGASVAPVTELGTKRIGYGAITNVPQKTFAIISQKKDGTLYMAVFRKCKISGDDKEQSFNKSKRLLPLALIAYPEDNAPQTENVYYEIEQVNL